MDKLNTIFGLGPREIMAAATDAITTAAGMSVHAPHPLAESLTLRRIAAACGLMKGATQGSLADVHVAGFGMTTTDFSSLLAGGMRPVALAAFAGQAEHMSYCVAIEVPNFKLQPVASVDVGVTLEPVAPDGHMTHGIITLPGAAHHVRAVTHGRALVVSRHLILSSMADTIARSFKETGNEVARMESRLVANALESNELLEDGLATFGAAYDNVLAQAFDATQLGVAIGMLRKQKVRGDQVAGWRAKHLVVGADMEYAAHAAVRDANIDIDVVCNPWLPADRWYLMADKERCPTVGVLRVAGAKAPLRVESATPNFELDGTGVQVTADLGATMLRRTGIVRGGV